MLSHDQLLGYRWGDRLNRSVLLTVLIMNWWIVFVVWLTDERRLALSPAGTIVRDPHHRESASKVWTCAESEFSLSWMKLCSSDNHYTKAKRSFMNSWTYGWSALSCFNWQSSNSYIMPQSAYLFCLTILIFSKFKVLTSFNSLPCKHWGRT